MDHPTRIGKYELEQFLGGGMSRVYRAKDSVLGRRVAVKILTDAGAADPEAKARFLQEARTASSINHDNIISVYDFGEEQGRPFMVMEFLEGESLRDAIRHGRAGELKRRLEIAVHIGRAIDHIHSRKIVHRDIKPENIHIDVTGRVRLMDFGIAKSEGVALTRVGFTLGTPYYMAPEQVMGLPLTPKADVYSFGILLFELLAETKPINGASVNEIFDKILHEPLNLAPLAAHNVPPAIAALIASCTAKDTAARPAGLAPVCQTIQRVLSAWKTAPMAAQQPSAGNQPAAVPAAPRREVRDEVLSPTVTAAVPVARRNELELPKFMENLPPQLQTQGGLMLLGGAAVVVGLTLLYLILTVARIV